MKLNLKRYIITTKSRPFQFYYEEDTGELTEYIEDALLFRYTKFADDVIRIMDEPELYEVHEVNLSFEF